MAGIRLAHDADRRSLARLRHALWPEGSLAEHERELEQIFDGTWSRIHPYVVFVSESASGEIVGFAEVSVRSRADGCDPSRPVGYLEGWYVSETDRRRGIGAELLQAAEEWARAQGCVEMASDTWIDNEISQRAHEMLGFEVVDRCVNYKKRLDSAGPRARSPRAG